MNEFDRTVLRQSFIEALPDFAMVALDVEGNIQTWNAGARILLGYDKEEVINRHFSFAYTIEDRSNGKAQRDLAAALELRRLEEITRRIRKDGEIVEIKRVLMPIYGQHETLLGYGSVAHPVGAPKHKSVSPLVSTASHQRQEHILVVDDDDQIREIAARQLTSLGYKVTTASDGTQALEILKQFTDIDALFTDVSMPGGLGGRELAAKARQLRPGLKVLFASGYFAGALVNKGDLEESVEFLVKPYRKKDLAAKLQQVLRGTRP